MPTVREMREARALMAQKPVAKRTASKPHRSGEKKRDKISKIIKENGGCVSFVVETPGSSENRLVQSVILKDAKVKKSSEGNYLVIGRDIEHEERVQASSTLSKRKPYSKRNKDEKVFRSYRVDRIIRGTIR